VGAYGVRSKLDQTMWRKGLGPRLQRQAFSGSDPLLWRTRGIPYPEERQDLYFALSNLGLALLLRIEI
jgi:hypothetical protein